LIDRDGTISIARQCDLLGLHRSGLYYEAAEESAMNLELMKRIDKVYTARPFFGARKITDALRKEGYLVNHKRIERLMGVMGVQAIYQKPRTSKPAPGHKIYPYLLRDVRIDAPDHVWSSDITYIPMRHGFMYLVAIIDWFSRFVLAWELSNTIDTGFCINALEKALAGGKPLIFNTDQGAQFTAEDFTNPLKQANVNISMDGKGRALDNVFIERLWRSVKYEDIYLHEYEDGQRLFGGLQSYFEFYNYERPHQALGYRTPAQVYKGGRESLLI
jgi:putative transposase